MTRSAAHLGAVRERLVLLGLCHGFIFIVLLVALSGALVWRMEPRPWLGNLADLPVGRVMHRPLALSVEETIFGTRIRTTRQFPVVAVYVVRPSRSEIRIFSQWDPYSGCSLIWAANERHFIDVCRGTAYRDTGEAVRGPANRALQPLPHAIRPNGNVVLRMVGSTS